MNYDLVFNRLCHLVALSKEGKTKSAIDNLVATVFGIDSKLVPSGPAEVMEAVNVYFSLDFPQSEIQASIDRLLGAGNLIRDRTGTLSLLPKVRAEIEQRILDAAQLEKVVREEWLDEVQARFGDELARSDEQLWNTLKAYMARVFRRHGAETMLLLDPSQPLAVENEKTLSVYLGEAIAENCDRIDSKKVQPAVRSFFARSTAARTKYVSQLLDSTFTFFALGIDEITTEYLKGTIPALALFLDTNFIYGVLGLHLNHFNEISQDLIDIIQNNKFPFKLYYHAETLRELERITEGSEGRLVGRKWSQEISRAAVKSGQIRGLEYRYHEKNAQIPTPPDIFMSKYKHMPQLLGDHGFKIYTSRTKSAELDEQRHLLVADYNAYIEERLPNRPKSYNTLNHDIVVWQTVQSLRKNGTMILDVGAFFLSVDHYFYAYDWQRLRGQNQVGTVIMPNQFFQLLRPFMKSTEEFDQRFVETFSLPEFRAVGGDYATTHSNILAYLNSFKDMKENTAVKILTNELLVEQLNKVNAESEEFRTYIDSALAKDNEELMQRNEQLKQEVATAKDAAAKLEAQLLQTKEELEQRIEASINEQRLLEQKQTVAIKDLATHYQSVTEEQTRQNAQAMAEMQKERARLLQLLRFSVSALVLVIGLAALFLLPVAYNISWLLNHSNRLTIYAGSLLALGGVCWAIADGDKTRRWFALGTVAVGAVLVVIQAL